MSAATRNEPKPPLIWTNTLMFVLTALAAAVLVPWYGLTHGFTGADVGVFLFFLIANGMAITAGYHRLWAHRTYEAHWSLRRVLPDLRHHVPAEQRLRLVQRPSRASSARGR